jgi:hypothetical protein
MFWGWSISKKDLLERQYNLSKEVESLNNEIALLEERISALEPKPKKQAKKTEKKKTSKGPNKIRFYRKSEKSLDNFIARKIKEGYLLVTKTKLDESWEAVMEKAK